MNAELDFSPPMRPNAAGMIGAHVALEVSHGRSLREIASDRLLQVDYDDHPFLLDELAADPAVRTAFAPPPAQIAPAALPIAA